MSPGSRVVYGKRFLRAVGLVRRLELHTRVGTLVSVDQEGYAEVLFDGDEDPTPVLAENMTHETQQKRLSWVPSALSAMTSRV